MEICGGQTHSIMRYGIGELLPPDITLLHGPGCPVCVTPLELIDRALAIASQPGTILCSFGDMLRVPGSHEDLFAVRARGGDVRVVYSPLDSLEIARQNPHREVVFFAVGFETTAPATALAVAQAAALKLQNFSLLVSHVLVPPAMEAMLSSPHNTIDAFLAAGHVCAVMGAEPYRPLASRFNIPIVITGFEPLDLLQGILMCVKQLEESRAEVENQYTRSVRLEGNVMAQRLLGEVFTTTSRQWRGIGEIPASGLALAPSYRSFDAAERFDLTGIVTAEPVSCLSGQVLLGVIKPTQCPAFAISCTPESPLGAPMVSGEGACAAYFRYGRDRA